MKERLSALLTKFARLSQYSKSRLTLTTLGSLWLACGPFWGFQTPLAILLAVALGTPVSYSIAVLFAISNPITIPFFIIMNYLTGIFLFVTIPQYCNWPIWRPKNPSMVQFLTKPLQPLLQRYLGLEDFYIGYFLIGGMVFATICALLLYPWIHRAFVQIKKSPVQ